jgi:hypothetical protein
MTLHCASAKALRMLAAGYRMEWEILFLGNANRLIENVKR